MESSPSSHPLAKCKGTARSRPIPKTKGTAQDRVELSGCTVFNRSVCEREKKPAESDTATSVYALAFTKLVLDVDPRHMYGQALSSHKAVDIRRGHTERPEPATSKDTESIQTRGSSTTGKYATSTLVPGTSN